MTFGTAEDRECRLPQSTSETVQMPFELTGAAISSFAMQL
jgi:hypothetical protein